MYFIINNLQVVKIDNEQGDFRYFVINLGEMLKYHQFFSDFIIKSCIILREVMGEFNVE